MDFDAVTLNIDKVEGHELSFKTNDKRKGFRDDYAK
jgi:hypothetical protein